MAHSNGKDVARDVATGHLIAAAPDLLAALKELVNWWDIDGGNLDRALSTALAAIARAEGRAP